jgi:hypothetical protein
MENQKEHNESTKEEMQNKNEPEDDHKVDPSNREPGESESFPHDETTFDTNDSQSEEMDINKEFDTNLPKRGPLFRKKLLKRIPFINYPNTLESKDLALESWLETVLNLKVSDYLESLQKLDSKKNL